MSNRKIIRAWKDEAYRLSLSEAERAVLPEHPAGLVELTDADLGAAAGGISLFFCWLHAIATVHLGCGGFSDLHC